jgi:plastocyanin
MKRIVLIAALATALAAAVPAVAATPTFKGNVGPGFTIKMVTKPTKAGQINLVIDDKSNIHNFHLLGPGGKQVAAVVKGKVKKLVDTGVSQTGTTTFTVTLKKGTYTFVCDPHASSMKGSFTVK